MNPLRVDDKPGADTRVALEHGGDVLSTGAMTGAAQLLNVCVDALKEKEGGGADGG